MIKFRSPTRIDLAGGTLDLWPLHSFFRTSATVNFAIDIHTEAFLTELEDEKIRIKVEDLGYDQEFPNLNEALISTDKELALIREQMWYWQPETGFELVTRSESPVGGGLGGSSSLMISMIEAFAKLEGREMEVLEKIHLAHNMEANILNAPTGTQDYFAPVLKKGMVIIDYSYDGTWYETKELPADFSQRFLLVDTGKPHNSGINNWKVLKDCVEGDQSTRMVLEDLREVAFDMKLSCQTKSWADIPDLLHREYAARIKLAEAFASPEIVALNDIVGDFRSSALKICGAGGGGCVMIWTNQKREMAEACQKAGYRVLDAKPA